MVVSDCSGARVECASTCGRVGINDFTCDEPGWFTEGSWYCSCNNLVQAVTSCFAGSSTVMTISGKRKMMKELKLGDLVLTVNPQGDTQFAPVYLFSSYRPSQISSFVRISTESGANITLTPGHFLFAHRGPATEAIRKPLSDWKYLLPHEVSIGDYVPVIRNSESKAMSLSSIIAIENVKDVGVFMPHTMIGSIVVDGVVATELTDFVPHWAAGHRFHKVFTSFVRVCLAIIPRGLDFPILRTAGKMLHGESDINLSRSAFFNNGDL